MTRASIKFLSVAFIAALPMLASAQLTGNVSLTSNYKFRGPGPGHRQGQCLQARRAGWL